MPKLNIPCEDCEETKQRLELAGNRVLSCDPKAGDPGMCVITFEPKAAKKAAKKKKVVKKRKATRKKAVKKAKKA
jgi:hypothetical protein